MVVCESAINNIMGGIENTGGVTLHNHRRKLKQRFDIIKKLGQGTYGKVQLGINKETGQEVAIKTIKKCKIETEADLIRIRREIQIMSSVQHPNIIHIYEVFENREKMVLVMEYAAGGELYDYLSERKVLTEDEARRIFRQIATAVYYCHKHKICHRDLKLENILLDENGSAKIADFGLSNVFDERRLLSTFCGSPLYASPEIVKGTPYHGPEVDCWSLGVLLYTLVYGAMPFDGSNFKRLVKQISQGDYFEPKKPSSASPLIRDMLTVVSEKRANIENICAHWWVNTTYPDSCLDIAEELANQTPVRLDLLLSLVPPLPQAGSDQLMIAGESSNMTPAAAEASVPTRSQSVGSLMDLVPSAEKRIRDLVSEDKQSPKRKLEVTVSTENANLSNSGAKRKEKPPQKIDEDLTSAILLNKTEIQPVTDVAQSSQVPVTKNLTQILVPDVELKSDETAANDADEECDMDPNLQGAACTELIEESKKNEMKEKKKVIKVKKVAKVDKPTATISKTSAENDDNINDKENKSSDTTETEKKDDTKIPVKRKIIKKKPLTDKANVLPKESKTEAKAESKEPEKIKPESLIPPAEEPKLKIDVKNENEESQPPSKPVERRRSKIFETAEKFQNLLTNNESKTSILDKPKKIFIPGVNVGGFKKEFERKASLTSTAVPDLKKALSRKSIPNKSEETSKEVSENNSPTEEIVQNPITQEIIEEIDVKSELGNSVSPIENDDSIPETDEEQIRKKNAISMISNFISKEGTRKSKSRPCMMRKPPVPFGINGRSASGSIGLIPAQLSPTHKAPEDSELGSPIENNVKSSAEITLKSATLPRRKTAKAEIKLDYPPPKPAQMEFKTEMAHRVESRPELKPQRSEIIVPVKNDTANRVRSTSLDPELKFKESPKERIIPISFEKEDNGERTDLTQSKPPMPKPYQSQRSVQSQRFGSLSRQSTHDSDSEATISESMDPIRKSPREYIIPIAVEGGGYVTPRATSLEPSDSSSTMSSRRPLPKLSQMKRLSSLLNHEGLDDGLAFSSLHRHNSVNRDSDNEDSRSEPLHMHRLRSSRPTQRPNLEHTDSLSSGEEDDDDGFEILTAEKLFSTLLSRVRSLTQRLNVEDNGRLGAGFPRSRLFDSFDHGSKLWKDPMSRFSPMDRSLHRNQSNSSSVSSDRSGAPWRRSVSRDLATDIERVYNDTPTATATMPRDKSKKHKEVNLEDLQLSDKDAIALSYLTPGLSRRIQSQLLSQLPTSRSRRSTYNNDEQKTRNRSKDRYRDSETPNEHYKHNTLQDEIAEELDFKTNNKTHGHDKNRTHSEDNGLHYFKLSDLKKQAAEEQREQEQSDDGGKYKPYRHCYRSHSLMEPNNSYRNPLYGKNTNYSSGNVEPVYEDEQHNRNSYSPTPKYNIVQRGSLSRDIDDGSQQVLEPSTSGRRVSRFLRPDFYSNCVYTKEKQKREIETQKVLQEIRNKKHSDHRDPSINDHTNNESSNDKNTSQRDTKPKIIDKNYVSTSPPPKNTETLFTEVVVDKPTMKENTEQEPKINNIEEKKTKRESKISKLIRPKSFPTECKDIEKNENKPSTLKKKIFSRSTTVDKPSPTSSEPHSSNQFLNSIEKKIRSIYLESTDKTKCDPNSRVKSTIRSLREQSEPRNMETCVTESGLIKRAVSSEDFSTFGSNKKNVKTLQPSRKSVSKILGLFKKYEDKPGSKVKESSDGKKVKSKKNKTDSSTDASKCKTKSVKEVDNKSEQTSSTRNSKSKANGEENVEKKCNTNRSKLPVSPFKYSSPEAELKGRSDRSQSIVNERKYVPVVENYRPDRKDLKLDLSFSNNQPQRTQYNSQANNSNKEENGVLSPSDDSLSMCSDFHLQDMSPVSDFKANSEEEANESMIDRIRRKSFYSRFNEKKKPRKSSILGNSLDYYTELANSHSGKSKKTKEHTNDVHVLNKSLTNSHVLMPTAKDVREYRRGFSMNDSLYPDTSNRYRDSTSYTNASMDLPDEKIKYDVDNNHKSLIAKPRGSNRRTSAPRYRDSSITPRETISPNNDSDIRSGPSTSVSPQM